MTSTETRKFVTTITSYGVRVGNHGGFVSQYSSFAKALRGKVEWARVADKVELVATLSGGIGTIDLDGALLYDGSTWEDNGEYCRPVLVKGHEY